MISKVDKITGKFNEHINKQLEKHIPSHEKAFATLLFEYRELWLIENELTAKDAIGYFYYRVIWFKNLTGHEKLDLHYVGLNELSTDRSHAIKLEIMDQLADIFSQVDVLHKLTSTYKYLLLLLDQLAMKHGTTLTNSVEFVYEELFQNEQ